MSALVWSRASRLTAPRPVAQAAELAVPLASTCRTLVHSRWLKLLSHGRLIVIADEKRDRALMGKFAELACGRRIVDIST